MKYTLSAAAIAASLGIASAQVQGFDISHWQETVDYAGAYASGARFVIIKATEGTSYIDPSFNTHYPGATDAGLIRGGYHFAQPASSSGSEQAEYFLAHGGGWSNDGITLPGMLDIEASPSGEQCYGLSAASMVAWIQEFVDTYHGNTGRYPMIYSSPSWWSSCTGDSSAFTETCPLVMARWADSPGTPMGGWPFHTIWQYANTYEFGGDADQFNGDEAGLKKLATG
ncbi:hypothetical protein FQN55_007666 [Onygenales sp. PD_40]|nr:hypothetical protein FQN55_007666 [Onygenales sp. PD_40]KAK2770336.1 hypothetical protein FQN53_005624 [Emmonsiellopsis sp. PD_33]KAK2778542.1 hypothetical protein FQN52_002720 [Onygenales sp. PD_12]KAK2798514.1 hypothetical protein FQN51_007671 [Onygenales sp. PD_10]